jgi:hypothetical protein
MIDANGNEIRGIGLRDAKEIVEAMLDSIARAGGADITLTTNFGKIGLIKELRERTQQAAEEAFKRNRKAELMAARTELLSTWNTDTAAFRNLAIRLGQTQTAIGQVEEELSKVDPHFVGNSDTGSAVLSALQGMSDELGIGPYVPPVGPVEWVPTTAWPTHDDTLDQVPYDYNNDPSGDAQARADAEEDLRIKVRSFIDRPGFADNLIAALGRYQNTIAAIEADYDPDIPF